MLIETEILIGDIVELKPTKMSTIDDLDLEKCTVLELDRPGNRIKVVFNNDNSENETFFDANSAVDWFATTHVINIERDYKVIELTENQDTVTGQEACIITMARINKQAFKTGQGYNVVSTPGESITDQFVFMGFTADELKELEGTTNRLSFAQYKPRYAEIDYAPIKLWQPKIDIDEPGEMFTMRL